MGCSNVIKPLIAKGLKILALAVPLTILALITIMVAQAYNQMANFDFAGGVDFISTPAEVETGTSPNTAWLDR